MSSARSIRMKLVGRVLTALCGLLIAAGALGHSLSAGALMSKALEATKLAPEMQTTLVVVWHFAGLCMAVIGSLILWSSWRDSLVLTAVVWAMAYVTFGVIAAAWSGQWFYGVFAVLGLGVLLGVAIRSPPSTADDLPPFQAFLNGD